MIYRRRVPATPRSKRAGVPRRSFCLLIKSVPVTSLHPVRIQFAVIVLELIKTISILSKGLFSINSIFLSWG